MVKNSGESQKEGLTLQEAREYFLRKSSHRTMSQLLGEVIDRDESQAPIKNDSYADALELTHFIFSRTKKSLRILTGTYCGDFLHTLEESFSQAVKNIALLGETVKLILVGIDQDPQKSYVLQDLEKLNTSFKDNIEIKTAYVDKKDAIKHLIIADDKMVRVEEPHDQLNERSSADKIRADVYLNNETINKIKKSYFDKIWNLL